MSLTSPISTSKGYSIIDFENYVFPYDLKEDFSPLQIDFVDLYMKGNISATEAYLQVSNTKSKKTAKTKGYQLLGDEKIKELMYFKRVLMFKKLDINFITQIERLNKIYEEAMKIGNHGSAIKALEVMNKMLGWELKRVDITSGGEQININYINPESMNDVINIDNPNIEDINIEDAEN